MDFLIVSTAAATVRVVLVAVAACAVDPRPTNHQAPPAIINPTSNPTSPATSVRRPGRNFLMSMRSSSSSPAALRPAGRAICRSEPSTGEL
jgi:hypothetical protein